MESHRSPAQMRIGASPAAECAARSAKAAAVCTESAVVSMIASLKSAAAGLLTVCTPNARGTRRYGRFLVRRYATARLQAMRRPRSSFGTDRAASSPVPAGATTGAARCWGSAFQANEVSSALQAVTSSFTASTETLNIPVSSSLRLISTIFSTPPSPMTTGTPT